MTFLNSLDPDQAQQNVGPDLDSNYLIVKEFMIKMILKQIRQQKMHVKLPSMHRVKP